MTLSYPSVLATEATPISVEDVQQWADEFNRLNQRFAPHFKRVETKQHAQDYLQGLLSSIERKSGWQIAEQVGDRTPYAIQHLLGRSVWDADSVRDELQDYVAQHLGHPDGVIVVDETGFLKKGNQSVGVQRQYSGTAGRIENCQIGVFLSYATPDGYTFLDRELYLPKSWTDVPEQCWQVGVPDTISFATKRNWLGKCCNGCLRLKCLMLGLVGMKCTAVTDACDYGSRSWESPMCWRFR